MFSKGQQSGILLLVVLIFTLLSVHYFIDFSSDELELNTEEVVNFRKEIDSLKLIEIENNKPKLYPFNPNYITDFKGYTLGMTTAEIDRLLEYRKQDKWINSTKQFQEVTNVSDSLLDVISPYFKFPDWVSNPKPNKAYTSIYNSQKSFAQKIDLNIASAVQLQTVNGVGEKLSERIIRYRNKFVGGFIADEQLNDVYGLTPEVIERITNDFTVKTPRVIQKIDLNSATVEQLVTIQHIDYDIAYNIVEERRYERRLSASALRDGFDTLEELTKVKEFPIQKIDIIKLYLSL